MVFEVVRKNTLVAHALQMKNEKILASINRNVFICLLCGSRIQMMSAAQVLRLMILLYMYSYINVSKHRTLTLEKKISDILHGRTWGLISEGNVNWCSRV